MFVYLFPEELQLPNWLLFVCFLGQWKLLMQKKNSFPFHCNLSFHHRRVKEKFVIAMLCSESSGCLWKTFALKFKDAVAEEEEEEEDGGGEEEERGGGSTFLQVTPETNLICKTRMATALRCMAEVDLASGSWCAALITGHEAWRVATPEESRP